MRRVLLIGHRGAAGEAPENTLAAMGAALTAKADAVEIDLRLSRDGVAVVIHDATLDRTTGTAGQVGLLTMGQLAAAHPVGGAAIPALDDVLDFVGGRCTVFCELKADLPGAGARARLVRSAAAVIRRHRAEAWTAFHSFDASLVAKAREECPAVCSALVTAGPVEGGGAGLLEAALRAGAQAISVSSADIDGSLVRTARLRHLTVWAWTADTSEEWARLTAAGVDGIITNFPAALRAYLDGRE